MAVGTNAPDMSADFILALKKIDELKAENRNLKCQLGILKEKYDDLWLSHKYQMSKIVEYRRKLEHYEDGAPMYVQEES